MSYLTKKAAELHKKAMGLGLIVFLGQETHKFTLCSQDGTVHEESYSYSFIERTLRKIREQLELSQNYYRVTNPY